MTGPPYRHDIDPSAAAEAVRELAEALNAGRIGASIELRRRLEELGLVVSPQQGKSRRARERAAAESAGEADFPDGDSVHSRASAKARPDAANAGPYLAQLWASRDLPPDVVRATPIWPGGAAGVIL
jgi:hypothetical protein